MIISHEIFLRMRNVSYKAEDKIKTHFPFSITFSENCAFVSYCGENILQLDRLQMTMQYGAEKKCEFHEGLLRQEYRHTPIIFICLFLEVNYFRFTP